MNYWIAVVDDDAMSLKNAKTILTAHGMRVSCLRSGDYLMRFIENNIPDLILLDIQMPGTDGFAAFDRLRKFEKDNDRRHIPVIFLSGDSDIKSEHRSLKIGAADYIRKPFDTDILLSRIHNAVRNSKIIENLTEEAEHDKLTGFLNKSSGTKKISELCAAKSGALLIMDIDSFKLVNDLFGHETGDKLLAAFADIVRMNTRGNDVVSRIGGDEFLAFFSDITDENDAEIIVCRLNEQIIRKADDLMGEDHDIPIGISVGAALAPVHSTDFDTLFRYADQAMYKVKKNGKHGFAVYDFLSDDPGDPIDLDEDISRITKIVEERGAGNGAMMLGQDSFSWNYRFIMRFIKRYKGEATKFIFSVSADNAEAVNEFSEVLQKTLRISDIIMQTGTNRFFLLLPELAEHDVPNVADRILTAWDMKKSYEDVIIEYSSVTVSFKDD